MTVSIIILFEQEQSSTNMVELQTNKARDGHLRHRILRWSEN